MYILYYVLMLPQRNEQMNSAEKLWMNSQHMIADSWVKFTTLMSLDNKGE